MNNRTGCLGILLMLAFFAMLVAGCSRDPVTQASKNRPYRHPSKVYDIDYVWVVDFKTEDGVRCVTTNRGGITCDWSKP